VTTGASNPAYQAWAQPRQSVEPTATEQALERSTAKLAALEQQAAALEAMSPELRDARARLRRLGEEQQAEREQAERDSQKRLASAHQHYLHEINGAPTRRAS